MRTNTTLIALSVAALLTGAACRGKADAPSTTGTPPPTTATPPATTTLAVSAIDLGRSLNPDKTIGDNTTTFKPTDTIYVSVATQGTSSGANLSARFTYGAEGQVVKEENRQIAPGGAATTEFHIAKPDGWPEGEYKVEVSLNGTPSGTKSFEVRKG
jgi:hypothetical protein